MAEAPLLRPFPPLRADLEAFLNQHIDLLQLEREADEEQTRLLNSNCSPRLLEQRGLALGGLGVAGISQGLGGKRWVLVSGWEAGDADCSA
jgi:DNA polymerase alpha-associated DNA helicase A